MSSAYSEDDILDNLGPAPNPPITPAPGPDHPGPAPAGPAHAALVWLERAGIAALFLGVGVVLAVAVGLYRDGGPGPEPEPGINGARLGRDFRHPHNHVLAESLRKRADEVEKKTPMDKADEIARKKYVDDVDREFLDRNGSIFAKVLAPGSEPKDETQRAEFVKLLRDFANGLDEAH